MAPGGGWGDVHRVKVAEAGAAAGGGFAAKAGAEQGRLGGPCHASPNVSLHPHRGAGPTVWGPLLYRLPEQGGLVLE